jgi:hypothetical protein
MLTSVDVLRREMAKVQRLCDCARAQRRVMAFPVALLQMLNHSRRGRNGVEGKGGRGDGDGDGDDSHQHAHVVRAVSLRLRDARQLHTATRAAPRAKPPRLGARLGRLLAINRVRRVAMGSDRGATAAVVLAHRDWLTALGCPDVPFVSDDQTGGCCVPLLVRVALSAIVRVVDGVCVCVCA